MPIENAPETGRHEFAGALAFAFANKSREALKRAAQDLSDELDQRAWRKLFNDVKDVNAQVIDDEVRFNVVLRRALSNRYTVEVRLSFRASSDEGASTAPCMTIDVSSHVFRHREGRFQMGVDASAVLLAAGTPLNFRMECPSGDTHNALHRAVNQTLTNVAVRMEAALTEEKTAQMAADWEAYRKLNVVALRSACPEAAALPRNSRAF